MCLPIAGVPPHKSVKQVSEVRQSSEQGTEDVCANGQQHYDTYKNYYQYYEEY